MTFRPDARGIDALARTPEMTRYLARIADEGARDVEASAPRIVKHRGSRIYGEASDGEGRIIVDSPFWHWREYGTSKMAQRPYIRPTVQRLLARYGGRFTTTGR